MNLHDYSSMGITSEKIMHFMTDSLDVDLEGLDADTLLFSTGVIDSFALVSLMTFLESECEIRISPEAVTLENFDSVNKIIGFVNSFSNSA